MKSIEDYFVDWESHVFGYGYGSGEQYTIDALKTFLEAIPEGGQYDYRELEIKINPTVIWLLINTLCDSDIIDYGSSPRFGWLTKQGKALRDFVSSKTLEELLGPRRNYGYTYCYPDHCNCNNGDDSAENTCDNPFWETK